jgi:protein-S-isoprenylcysteine O-methyltransferase Ste14
MPHPDRPSRAGLAVAWLGGAVFVAALAAYVHFFVVRLAAPGPAGRELPSALAWNAVLFTVFALHHSLMARAPAKAWLTRAMPAAYERTLYVWIASALLILATILWRRVPGLVYVAPAPLSWLCLGLQGAGVVLTVAAVRVLSATDLAGIRQAGRRPPTTDVRLVWPYTVVRHPIYLGWALTVLAAPTMTVDRLWWAVLSTGYLVIAIPWEERSLSAVAGAPYREYQRRVRWRMVPGVY